MSLSAQFQAFGPVILASASPRRRDLLAQLEVPFQVVPSKAPEAHDENFTARELCEVNAYRKAKAVAREHPQNLVIAADTLVYDGTRLYGKPRDTAEAERMLGELSGHAHYVVTAVCLMCLGQRLQRTFSEITRVTFRSLSPDDIRRYVSHVHTLDKAGAYAIQESGGDIIESIKGSYSNVVGLPLERLKRELQQFAGVPH